VADQGARIAKQADQVAAQSGLQEFWKHWFRYFLEYLNRSVWDGARTPRISDAGHWDPAKAYWAVLER
jgi:hypothetical protein